MRSDISYLPWPDPITHQEGEVIVFDNVVAEVCSVCGDTLLPLSTVEALETMLKNPGKTLRTAPVYEMAELATA